MRTAIAILLALAVLAFAQDAPESKPVDPKQGALGHIEKGRAAISADRIQEAIGHLQKAIGKLQELVAEGLGAFMPKAPKDWKREKLKTQAGNWGSGGQSVEWHQATTVYRGPNGEKVDAMVSSSPQLIVTQRQAFNMYKNPQIIEAMNRDPNRAIVTIGQDGWVGWMIVQKGRGATLMAIHRRVMISLKAATDDLGLVKRFWGLFDRKGLAESVGK